MQLHVLSEDVIPEGVALVLLAGQKEKEREQKLGRNPISELNMSSKALPLKIYEATLDKGARQMRYSVRLILSASSQTARRGSR